MNTVARFIAITTFASTAALAAPVAAQSVEEFYSGTDIKLYIGYSPGGGYDTYARTLARHMGKHIPGNPNIIPVNRPGAGSLVLANQVGTTMPRDGSAIAIFGRAMVLEPLFGNEDAQFDPSEFNWIGSANNEVSVCVSWHETPVRSVEDLRTRGMVVGGTGAGADNDTFPRVLNNILGTRLRLITGYPGGNDVLLAMERGEVEGRCGYSYSSLISRRGDWLANSKVRILLQMSTAKHPAMPNVPYIMDLVRGEENRKALEIVFAPQAMGRPFVAPPDLPMDRIAALQAAFEATMQDPEFLADAAQQNLALAPINGQEIADLVSALYKISPEIVAAAVAARTNAANLPISEIIMPPTVSTGTITDIQHEGRVITYTLADGSSSTVSISGSRTKVIIAGVEIERANLTVGMSCEVSYPPSPERDIEALEVVCQ